MGKGKLIFVLALVVVISAVYVTGLGDDLVRITGNAVKDFTKEKVLDKLSSAEKEAEAKSGISVGDDKLKINLTNPLTGDKFEYVCEKAK